MMRHLPDKQKKINYLRLFPAEKKFKLFLFYSLTILLFTSSFFANAQRVYPDLLTTINSKGSDYYLTYTWEGLDVVNCGSEKEPVLEIWYKPNNSNPDIYFVDRGDTKLQNNDSKKIAVGPGQNGYGSIRYQEGYPSGGCLTWVWSGFPRAMNEEEHNAPGYSVEGAASTVAIKNPTNVTASNQAGFDYIELKWSKGTDIPDSNSVYRIYRDGILIDTANGDQRSWKDASVNPGATHSYSLRTYSTKWGVHESAGVVVTGASKSMNLTASDGDFTNRVRMEWVNISSFADNIRIERSVPNSSAFEEVEILNKNATFYNDNTAIPGYAYTYRLTPIKDGRTFPSYDNTGYIMPNGKISGTVQSKFGANVAGVTVVATGVVNGTSISSYNHNGTTIEFKAVTDAAGYYEIKNIYYFNNAEFTLTPSKGDHEFDPITHKRTLDQNLYVVNGVNFKDNTVYTIAGTVADPNGCPVAGVSMLLDGKDIGNRTNIEGKYLINVENEGTYNVKPDFYHHTFNKASENVTITTELVTVNFTDTQKEKVLISLLSGCGDAVTASFKVNIRSVADPATPDTYCYNQTITVNGSSQQIELPAQKYSLQIEETSHNNRNILKQMGAQGRIELDLTQPEIVNNVAVTRKAPFVFHEGLSVTFKDLPNTKCNNDYVMEQHFLYPIKIEVREINTYLNTSCLVNDGELQITDDVGDKGVFNIPAGNGMVTYSLKTGLPNIVAPYRKRFEVTAKAGAAVPVTASFSVIVTGGKPRSGTFVTRTPELPHLILHDPMGDLSYSYLQKDSSYTFITQTAVTNSKETGAFVNLKIGGGVSGLPFVPEFGAGIKFDTQLLNGETTINGDALATTITATQQLSTANTNVFTGSQGDVFVGASYNIRYGLIDIVKVENCQVVPDVSIYWNPESIATTYTYTDYQIRYNILTQLKRLKEISEKRATRTGLQSAKDTVQMLNSSINVWQQVLDNNDKQREEISQQHFVENRSFSAGAPFTSVITKSTENTTTYDFSTFIDEDVAIGGFAYLGGFLSADLGALINFKWSSQTTTNTSIAKSTTIGYHLDDDDIGDFFSVDIYNDPRYNTPLFKLNAGTSSCPNEPGTQTRDKPQIDLNRYTVSNVPANEPAVFVANIANVNESEEGREYAVRVVPATNMDGAIIRMGGQIINTTPVVFFLQPGPSIPITITVERGPYAFNYKDIQLMMYPECEYAIFQNGGSFVNTDTVSISVNFQSQCSTVQISKPGDNWLINQGSANKMTVTLTGYDVNNPTFTSVGLQYRAEGKTWETATTIPKAQLIDQFKDYIWDVSDLAKFADGKYEIRAFATCETLGQTTYSEVLKGNIDRASVAPFGTPSPADNFLRQGQNISVTFDKTINCSQNFSSKVALIRNDTGATLDIKVQCSGNTLIIKTNPETAINDISLAGVELTATVSGVEDNAGNIQKYPTVWSFKVNVKPVFWDPETLAAAVTIGAGIKLKAELKNTAEVSKAFKLSSYPAWLTPSAQKGVIQPYGVFPLEFAISDELKPGIYEGIINAEIDGFMEALPVKLELMAIPVAWRVNPAAYSYSMNMVVQYTLSNPPANTPTSTDKRDVIAAFVNGVPRGVAKIREIDNMPGKYAAFLTVYSNEAGAGKETITFRMWNALTGVEYGALEKPAFVADGITGNANAPYILHSEGTFQVIPLQKGWNWVSFNVSTPDMSREKVFSSLLASGNNITIKNQTSFTDFSPQSGWSGTLKTVNLTSGYMVYLSDKPDTLRLVGTTPTTFTPVSLTGGWNWIGYPKIMNAAIKTALGNTFVPKNDDFLKSFTSFATYATSVNAWLGDLKTMDPGQSYKLKISAPASLTYRRKATDGSNFEVNEHQYEYTMTLTGMLNLNGMPVANDQYSVGAYIKGVCRGFTQAEYMPNLKANRIYLTIYGEPADAGEIIEFRIFNSNTGEQIIAENKGVAFVTDKIVGAMVNPYLLNFSNQYLENGYALAQNKPNPFSATTTIEFTIPEEAPVELTLYDNLGKQVRLLMKEHKPAGNHTYILNASSLASGIYSYQLKVGSYVKTRKLVIVR
ncbi:T9SS type A sorting domain-containing protein [Adhaeribacter rhizoryzae]|uniref:T9SS type A sorting domain-containing protein n=1 Tax=Adhaeribacter rhizoryzae TaxID=2607907 RepID=A0A5M6DKQ5_9BACT|nr:T9SS type A sorting domain-containing protein [Adhaeribacter rhizoryzae]KAA5546770.1 T9SS type A sorting domain-containing protein [Adhaeribacter rhizoryzae]